MLSLFALILSLIFDFYCGAFLARRIKNIFLLIPASSFSVFFFALLTNLVFLPAFESITIQNLAIFVFNIFFHSLIVIVIALFNRKRYRKREDINPGRIEKEKRRQLALEVQARMQQEK